jgi:ABC-2 type transport system ATP-binding protein/lipopolysaccharide transport system ATP-binding protein
MQSPYIHLDDISFARPVFIRSQEKGYTHHSQILQNVSLLLEPGSRVGLMGLNGAGKTTLLRLMGGILMPTSGQIRTSGTISTLLTTSLGMKPNATGYENAKIMATLMGLSFDELPALLADVEEFTELGDKLKSPLKTYSNGMRTRLGFAVATSVNPDIMLIDEVIGAGDEVFREKARERIKNKMTASGIVVLASHGMGVLRQFCDQALVMNGGDIHFFGGLEDAILSFRALQKQLAA